VHSSWCCASKSTSTAQCTLWERSTLALMASSMMYITHHTFRDCSRWETHFVSKYWEFNKLKSSWVYWEQSKGYSVFCNILAVWRSMDDSGAPYIGVAIVKTRSTMLCQCSLCNREWKIVPYVTECPSICYCCSWLNVTMAFLVDGCNVRRTSVCYQRSHRQATGSSLNLTGWRRRL